MKKECHKQENNVCTWCDPEVKKKCHIIRFKEGLIIPPADWDKEYMKQIRQHFKKLKKENKQKG